LKQQNLTAARKSRKKRRSSTVREQNDGRHSRVVASFPRVYEVSLTARFYPFLRSKNRTDTAMKEEEEPPAGPVKTGHGERLVPEPAQRESLRLHGHETSPKNGSVADNPAIPRPVLPRLAEEEHDTGDAPAPVLASSPSAVLDPVIPKEKQGEDS
jgi:hypothetical protein